MVDVRENLGWILGSIVTTIAIAVGWFVQSGAMTNLLFVLLGAGITYFVQVRTQKRAWKREYSVKIAETVYGELYKEVKSLQTTLESEGLWQIRFNKWEEFQRDHRYFMVEEKFREKLDSFLAEVNQYNLAIWRLRHETLPEIVNEEALRIFHTSVRADNINLWIKYKEGDSVNQVKPDIIECLIRQTHPRNWVLEKGNKHEITEFLILFGQVDSGPSIYAKFDEFWAACLKRMKEETDYQHLVEKTNTMRQEAEYKRKELAERIEKPWKI